ncbi:MAG: hypothetical protein ACYCV7_14135 [Acidimicrobiales bacterium]
MGPGPAASLRARLARALHLQGDEGRSGELAATVGTTPASAAADRGRMADRGQVVKLGRGHWMLVENHVESRRERVEVVSQLAGRRTAGVVDMLEIELFTESFE